MVKNPYKFVEKANTTFNLYLSKFDEFDSFVKYSMNEQETINNKLDFFIELYTSNQNKLYNINNDLLDLFNKVYSEVNYNKKLINELKDNLDSMEGRNNDSQQQIINLLKESNENMNNLFLTNKNLILESVDVVNGSVRDSADAISNKVDVVNGSVRDSADAISNKVDEIYKSQEDYVEYSKQNDVVLNDFIKSQNNVNNDVMNMVNLFRKNYDECKMYFYNNQENELKKYLNTDDLFRLCYFNNIEFISYSPKENKLLFKTKDDIILASNNRFYTIKEVIGFKGYSIPQLYQFDDFIVIDIGMNRAYASLWFANFENCSAIYGFEIDDETFDKATYNINLNPHISNKIKTFNFGLSDSEEMVDLYYLEGCDGINTTISEFTNIQLELKSNKDNLKSKQVKVMKSSDVLSDIINKYKNKTKIILKIDTEGSEYKILNDLINSNLLNFVDVILGEGHIFSDESVSEMLTGFGFNQIILENHDFTYNFAFVNDEIYDVWPLKNNI